MPGKGWKKIDGKWRKKAAPEPVVEETAEDVDRPTETKGGGIRCEWCGDPAATSIGISREYPIENGEVRVDEADLAVALRIGAKLKR